MKTNAEILKKSINDYIYLIVKSSEFPETNTKLRLQELNEDYASLCDDFLCGLSDMLPDDMQSQSVRDLCAALVAVQRDINATNDEELLQDFIPQIEE